jgi:hypothetical protein
MAVADVAVSLGPRNQRRLAKSAIVIGVIAAVVATVLLTRSPQSQPPLSGRSAGGTAAANGRLVFGMTPPQVRRLTGRPKITQGSCWIYQAKAGMVGSVSLLPSGERVPASLATSELKLCFFAGVYSSASLRFFDRQNGVWRWVGWPIRIA